MSARDGKPGIVSAEPGNARTGQTSATSGMVARRESDGYVRERYCGRGQKGNPGIAASDRVDVKLAIDELIAAQKMLAEVETMPPGIARRELHKTAIGRVALASRACDEVVIRRGGSLQ